MRDEACETGHARRARAVNSSWPPRTSRSAAANSGASACAATYGIATQRIPAAYAAAAPGAASSRTTQRAGSAPNRRAASRKTSGAGLPRATSSAETTVRRCASRPVRARIAAMAPGEEPDATAIGTPSPASSSTNLRISGYARDELPASSR